MGSLQFYIFMHQHAHGHQEIMASNRIGAWASIICAVHCALTPLLFSVLPLLGLEFLHSHVFEIVLMTAGLGFGSYGILRAFLLHHRAFLPLALFIVGAGMVCIGLFLSNELWEMILVPSGAVLVGVAQVVNIQKCKSCRVH